MSNEQLKEYVAQSVAQGMKPEEVRASLVAQGWTGSDIDQALGAPAKPLAPVGGAVEGRPKWKIAAVIAAVVLVLGAGGAFAYLRFFSETPDQRVAKAVNAAIAAKSMEYAGSLRIEAVYDQGKNPALAMLSATNAPEQPVKLLITTEGAYDALGPGKANMRSSVTVATTQALGGAPLGTLESRRVDGVAYLSLTRVPEIPLFDLSSLAGVWVKVDPQALTGLIPSASSTSKTPKEGPTAAQREAIEKALIDIRPVSVVETLKDEDVGGVASRHYRLAVDKQKLRAFALKVQEIMDDGASLAYEKVADDYDKFSKQVEIETLEVWIGKAEGLPTRVMLKASAKKSEDVPGEGTFTFDMTFKNFGKPIAIEAPSDAKGLEDVLGMLMGGGEKSVTPKKNQVVELMDAMVAYQASNGRYPAKLSELLPASDPAFLDRNMHLKYRSIAAGRSFGLEIIYEEDGEVKAVLFTENSFLETGDTIGDDQDGLSEYREFIYGSDPRKADTDGDGFSDGDEVKNGYDPAGPGALPAP